MDRLESLGTQLSQITLYDIKSYYNQAKNMVLNVSEMEAKVKEATNEDPWGASSTLMQEIAQGTFNFQQFNEIMPCIYSRFMEKEAKQWREIYKALQLLEYIIKHGSERVVDDARSHLSTIKMLRNFHYIDEKGKDQGINVRNRSSEIAALLSDLDKIRTERRKAKSNRSKYVGTGNDGMMGFGGSSGRYGGFGDEGSYSGSGGGSSDYYNSGGNSPSFRDDTNRKGYDEYDAGEYDEAPAVRRSNSLRTASSPLSSRRLGATSSSSQPSRLPEAKAKEKEKEKPVPVDDLLGDWGNDSGVATSSTTISSNNKALPALVPPTTTDGDDFDDFQSAPVSPPPAPPAPPAPLAFSQTPMQPSAQGSANPNLFDMLNQSSSSTTTAPILQAPTQSWQQSSFQAQPARPNYFGGSKEGTPLTPTSTTSFTSNPMSGSGLSSGTAAARLPFGSTPTAGNGKASANFEDLWSLGLGSTAKASTTSLSNPAAGKSIKDLEKEKAQAGIWGAASQGHTTRASMGSFGAFGGSTAGGTSGGGGDDDLLL